MKKTASKTVIRGLKTAVLSLALAGLIALPALAQEGVIKYRQSVMKAVGAHYSALDSILKGKGGQSRDLKVHADALAALAKVAAVTAAGPAPAGPSDPVHGKYLFAAAVNRHIFAAIADQY